MSVDVLEGKVAFQNLEDHEFYQGQSTGKYSIVLSLDEKTSNNQAESNHANHDLVHDEHVFHQLSNKPWAALYVSAFFFFMISLGVLAFYAIQRAAQAGWSPVLYRVMEGITAYLLPGGIIVLVILILSTTVSYTHLTLPTKA